MRFRINEQWAMFNRTDWVFGRYIEYVVCSMYEKLNRMYVKLLFFSSSKMKMLFKLNSNGNIVAVCWLERSKWENMLKEKIRTFWIDLFFVYSLIVLRVRSHHFCTHCRWASFFFFFSFLRLCSMNYSFCFPSIWAIVDGYYWFLSLSIHQTIATCCVHSLLYCFVFFDVFVEHMLFKEKLCSVHQWKEHGTMCNKTKWREGDAVEQDQDKQNRHIYHRIKQKKHFNIRNIDKLQ